MKGISIKLPEPMFRTLTRTAEQRGVSVSLLVREAIDAFMARGPKKSAKGSFLDVAGDLVGCVDGPPDLATNPKYMEGFGE